MTAHDRSGSYEVGYGKPPRARRFKKGQSGNPKGRPRGTRNLATDLQAELNSKVAVTEGGRTHTVSKQIAMVKTLMARALKGDMRALQLLATLIDRLVSTEQDQGQSTPLADEDALILELVSGRATPPRAAGMAAGEPAGDAHG